MDLLTPELINGVINAGVTLAGLVIYHLTMGVRKRHPILDRLLSKSDDRQRQRVESSLEALLDFVEGGALPQPQPPAIGFPPQPPARG